jgi:GNAT superfamily N-acetyltransferase
MPRNLIICRPDLIFEAGDIIRVYHDAMITEPWFEDLPREMIIQRMVSDFCQPHSEQMVGKLSECICAAMWWDEANQTILLAQRGKELAEYCKNFSGRMVWFRDLLVGEQFQGMHIGGQMVDFAINAWRKVYRHAFLRIHLGGVDGKIPPNVKALKIYERRGFKLIGGIEQIAHDINGNAIRMGYMVCHL